MTAMYRPGSLLIALLCPIASACGGGFTTGDPAPQPVAELEAAVATDSRDADAWTRLGVAYGAADRPDDARQALERAVALPGVPAAAWAHLGTWREETGDLEGAAAAYRRYLAAGGRSAVQAVEARLAVVERELLARRAREALATESALDDRPADPSTVGVLPLTVEGPEEYRPLGVGLAELLTTDLSLTDRLDVVERAQLEALVQETRLALGGFTDPTSAARVGRLLRAGRLVQGRIAIREEDGRTRVDALILDAERAQTTGEAGQEGPLETLMDLEVQLALEIYRQLGVELTPAERARLEEKPTRNLQAFLAYSEGLQLMDAGVFDAAAQRFESAATLDPDFTAAQQAARQARGIAATGPGAVTQAASLELGPGTGAGQTGGRGAGTIERMVDATMPAGVAATATGAGTGSRAARSATVEPTETTAGTGVSQQLRVPIVLVRPRPHIILWRIP